MHLVSPIKFHIQCETFLSSQNITFSIIYNIDCMCNAFVAHLIGKLSLEI